jgi:hypothetical protein
VSQEKLLEDQQAELQLQSSEMGQLRARLECQGSGQGDWEARSAELEICLAPSDPPPPPPRASPPTMNPPAKSAVSLQTFPCHCPPSLEIVWHLQI